MFRVSPTGLRRLICFSIWIPGQFLIIWTADSFLRLRQDKTEICFIVRPQCIICSTSSKPALCVQQCLIYETLCLKIKPVLTHQSWYYKAICSIIKRRPSLSACLKLPARTVKQFEEVWLTVNTTGQNDSLLLLSREAASEPQSDVSASTCPMLFPTRQCGSLLLLWTCCWKRCLFFSVK